MTRRPKIPARVPIFLGCEGESEVGYGALLGRIANETEGLHLNIRVERLQPGAGDPHALIQRAIQKIHQRNRERFEHKAVLLDVGDGQKMRDARTLAARHGIQLIWQEPDHEAFLLRHLEDCHNLHPPAGQSMNELVRRWPGYEKGQTQVQLSARLEMAHVRRASVVEPDLGVFLRTIGML